jgi:hypothetical protein
MPNIDIEELKKITAYLEECNREGRAADLPIAWALLILRIIDSDSEASPEAESALLKLGNTSAAW